MIDEVEAPRPRRRWLRAAVGLLVVLILAGLALLFTARGPLLSARDAMEDGRAALLDGRSDDAGAAFTRAADGFAAAASRVRNPLTRLVSFLPIIGRTPDAASAASAAGSDLARAGLALTEALEGLPGGVSALAPRDGAIPIEPLGRIATGLARARSLVQAADERLQAAPDGLTPGVVAEPLAELRDEVSEALAATVAASDLAATLPGFLGADGTRTYFVGAQNPAELRGTGGLIGTYAILTVSDGRMELGQFADVSRLPTLDPSEVEAPTPEFAARYDRYGGAGFWRNINMTPDFPTAATAIEALWLRVFGERLDGTIVADPQALARLLEATGPATIPGTSLTLDEDSLVPFVTNEAYAEIGDRRTRQRVLGAVAGEVLARFLSGEGADAADAGRALAEAAAGGHLLLHAADAETQRAFEQAGVAGRLLDPPGDFLGVFANNAGGNKVDFFAERHVRYDVRLLPSGAAEATAAVRIRNTAPSSGQPRYVIGPRPGVAEAGENVTILDVFCARGCRVTGVAREGGARAEGGIEQELGHPVVWSEVRVPSGGSETVTYSWRVEDAWELERRGGTYRLTIQGQPMVRPAAVEVRVTAPPGMSFGGGTDGVEVAGDVATWRGRPPDVLELEVELVHPAAARLVRDVLPAPLL